MARELLSRAARLGALSISLALSGCASIALTERPLAFNEAWQDAANQQVLLNVVRASKRYPLLFTQSGAVTSTGFGDGSTIGLNIPFGPASKPLYGLTPSFRFQEGLSLSTQPLDTQEFVNGLMAPTKLSLVNYYLKNGWNKDLIFYTFIREINVSKEFVRSLATTIGKPAQSLCKTEEQKDCVHIPNQSDYWGGAIAKACPDLAHGKLFGDADEEPLRFVNSPSSRCGFLKFQYLLAMLQLRKLRVEPAPPAGATGAAKVPTSNPNVTLSLSVSANPPAKGEGDALVVDVTVPDCKKAGDTTRLVATVDADASAKCTMTVVPRAPEGVIFFMGQLVRAEHADLPTANEVVPEPPREKFIARIITRYDDDEGKERLGFPRLFSVERDSSDADPFVAVDLDGVTWSIPKLRSDGPDQTIHFMSLLEQLIALQKKGSEQPSIPTVRVIGQ